MKLVIHRFVYEPPALAIIAETDYEAAVLKRYWETAQLSIGKSHEPGSADGFTYGIKFVEPPTQGEKK